MFGAQIARSRQSRNLVPSGKEKVVSSFHLNLASLIVLNYGDDGQWLFCSYYQRIYATLLYWDPDPIRSFEIDIEFREHISPSLALAFMETAIIVSH